MHNLFARMTLLGGLLAGFACGGARAGPAEPAEPARTVVTVPADTLSAPQQEPPLRPVAGLGTPLKVEQLTNLRGGTDTMTAQATLGATVANNTAVNVVSGNNTIDGGAFANMSGLPMVIQNSGANVLIQNATVINLQLK